VLVWIVVNLPTIIWKESRTCDVASIRGIPTVLKARNYIDINAIRILFNVKRFAASFHIGGTESGVEYSLKVIFEPIMRISGWASDSGRFIVDAWRERVIGGNGFLQANTDVNVAFKSNVRIVLVRTLQKDLNVSGR